MKAAIVIWSVKAGEPPKSIKRLHQSFDYACRAFGVPLVFVDADGTLPENIAEPVYESLDEALDALGGVPIYTSRDAPVSFKEAVLPADAVLVVGGDYDILNIPDGAFSISIPQQNPAMELWSHQVLAILLAHTYTE